MFLQDEGDEEKRLIIRRGMLILSVCKLQGLSSGNLQEFFIGEFLQGLITRVSGYLVGAVAAGVVTGDKSPAVVWAFVLIGAMEQIGMEEDGRACLHFAVDQFEFLESGFDTFRVGACLISDGAVIQASQAM